MITLSNGCGSDHGKLEQRDCDEPCVCDLPMAAIVELVLARAKAHLGGARLKQEASMSGRKGAGARTKEAATDLTQEQ